MGHDQGFLEYDQALEAPPEEVGGKARTLALCRRAGLTVPDGVILPRSLCFALDGDRLPDQLFRAISHRMGDAELLVVRSSAPGEDSERYSWAGQFASPICRNEPAAIRAACLSGWSSAAAAAASAYAAAVGQEGQTGSGGMALLVQRMIPATAAGVCFTPGATGGRGGHLVDAVHGMCGALTDDEVRAERHEVDLAGRQASLADGGQQAGWRSPADPWSLADLPAELAGRPALEAEQAVQVAELAQKAAGILNNRADVEWALAGKTLYLLQARPVTAAAGRTTWISWTRDNAADVIPGAVTPLTWSFLGPAVNRGFRHSLRRLRTGLPPQQLFLLFDGRAYFNMTAYSDLAGETGRASGLLALGTGYLRLLLGHKAGTGRAETRFPRELAAAGSGSPRDTLAALQRLLDRYMLIHVRTTVLLDLGLQLLKSVLRRRAGEDEARRLAGQLLGGSGQLASCESVEALRRLAGVIGQDPGLARRLREAAPHDVARFLSGASQVVSNGWCEFLRRHGHGALEEFELLRPRWREHPDFAARALQMFLAEENLSPAAPAGPSAEELRQAARQQVKRHLPLPLQLPVQMLAAHLRRCSLLRESFKQLLVRIVAAARARALDLAAEQAIDPPELVFFLTMEEALGQSGGDRVLLRERAVQHRQDWQEAAAAAPWAEVREYPDGRLARITRPERHGTLIQGLALSHGHHTGTARLVLDPSRAGEFSKGDVLVTRATNPSWTPLIALAGAVATDMGNYLSHGAIVARELGIPAVGNLYDATTRISDGQRVEVDGDQGLVRLFGDQ